MKVSAIVLTGALVIGLSGPELLRSDPPPLSSCPATTLALNHCQVMAYDFSLDPDSPYLDSAVTFSLLQGLGEIDPFTGVLIYEPSLSDVGMPIGYHVQAEFSGEVVWDCWFQVMFVNQAPTVSSPGLATVAPGTTIAVQLTSDDVDCDTGWFSIVSVTPEPAGAYAVDASSGELTFVPAYADAESGFTFVVQYTDGVNSASCEQSIAVLSQWEGSAFDLAGPPTGSYDLNGARVVYSNFPITWTFRMTIGDEGSDYGLSGMTNALRVYLSSDPAGSSIAPVPGRDSISATRIYDMVGAGDMDLAVHTILHYGEAADSVDFSAFDLWDGSNLVPGFDQLVAVVSTEVDVTTEGLYLCIDSTWFPPGGSWAWFDGFNGEVIPSWGGPYCYEIVNCCQLRGDVNLNGSVDVTDLIQEITYLFLCGGDPTGCAAAPACPATADINNDGSTGVADLTYLIAYLFRGGPAPVLCP